MTPEQVQQVSVFIFAVVHLPGVLLGAAPEREVAEAQAGNLRVLTAAHDADKSLTLLPEYPDGGDELSVTVQFQTRKRLQLGNLKDR